MSLRDEILANPACAEALVARDCETLARIVSVGRTRASSREIGYGTALEVLGIAAGNAFLDVISNHADYRYVRPLVEQGRLLVGSALAQAAVQSMVPAVLTQDQADKLCAVGHEAAPVSAQEVADAMFHPDGTQK